MFLIEDDNGVEHKIELKQFGEIQAARPERRIACHDHAGASSKIISEIAVYSDDRGIDFWRKIHDFIEVK